MYITQVGGAKAEHGGFLNKEATDEVWAAEAGGFCKTDYQSKWTHREATLKIRIGVHFHLWLNICVQQDSSRPGENSYWEAVS